MNILRKFFKKRAIEIAIDKKELVGILPADPVILEAGVCDGSDTEEFALCFPTGKIHGFECLPHFYDIASRRLKNYKNVTLYPFAISNVTTELDFHVSTRQGDFYGSGSIFAPKLHTDVHPEILFEKTIKVQALSIDDWARQNAINKVDFLWLDLQGAEVNALLGATKILEGVTSIFTEVSLIETYERVPLYDDVKTFLNAKGFRVAKEYLPYKDMGNILFVKDVVG